MYPDELRYSESHEWVRVSGDRAVVGITQYAAEELGEVTYLELPEVGSMVHQGEPFGVIESIKAVEDLLSPVSGTVVEVNSELSESLDAITESPYGDGWMLVVELEDPSELDSLLTAEEYQRLVAP